MYQRVFLFIYLFVVQKSRISRPDFEINILLLRRSFIYVKINRNRLIIRSFSAFLVLCMVFYNMGFLFLTLSIDAGKKLVTIYAVECENEHLMISSRVQSNTIVLAGETVLVYHKELKPV